MTIGYSKFFPPTVLTTTPATLFTVQASPTTSLFRGGRVRFSNTTAAAVTATAFAIPAAGTAGTGNICLPPTSIAANGYIDVDVPIMGAGDFFQAQAGAAASITVQPLAGSVFS